MPWWQISIAAHFEEYDWNQAAELEYRNPSAMMIYFLPYILSKGISVPTERPTDTILQSNFRFTDFQGCIFSMASQNIQLEPSRYYD